MATLFLIPTTLDPEIKAAALIPEQILQIKHLENFIVETAKIGRAHLKLLDLNMPLQQLNIMELNKHKNDYTTLVDPLKNGYDVGLISDCGLPAVADPGSRLVALAHVLGYDVKPLIGPGSIFLTLMASGLNGQKFSFLGYLPAEPDARKKKLRELELTILKDGATQIFIETPFRNQKLFEAILSNMNQELKLCMGINLMTDSQQIITNPIHKWRNKPVNLDKKEVIFLLGQ